MNRLRRTVVKNAVFNMVRGGATAIVAIALPHYLSHGLDKDRFAAWSLMLQLAAYASVLDFGLQTAVSRFIAQAIELGQRGRIQKLVETSFAMLSLAAVLALIVIGVLVLFAGSFFHGVPPSLLREFQIAAIIMAVSAALLLPLSTFTGVLVGMHENEFPAVAVGGSRLLGAFAAIVAVRYTHSLVLLAVFVAVPNLAGGLVQIFVVSRRLAGFSIGIPHIDRTTAVEFLHYCTGLAVWSLAMLFVSGLDVTIVGHFQFQAVGYYALAATLMTLFASGNSSVLSALLAPFSAMQARGDYGKMRDIVLRATRINTLVNVIVTAVIIAYGERLLRIWVGSSYAHFAYPVLVVLTCAQSIRLAASGYSIALMATGHQNSAIWPAVIEGVVNLGASLWAVTRFGPLGVAWGSLVGAVVAIPALLILAVKVRDDLKISRVDLGVAGILFGAFPALPMLLCATLIRVESLSASRVVGLWALSVGIGILLMQLAERFAASRYLIVNNAALP